MKPYVKNGWLVHRNGVINLSLVKLVIPYCGETKLYVADKEVAIAHKYETIIRLITETKCPKSSKKPALSHSQAKRVRS